MTLCCICENSIEDTCSHSANISIQNRVLYQRIRALNQESFVLTRPSSVSSCESVFCIKLSWYFLLRNAVNALVLSPFARHCRAISCSRSRMT